MSVAAHPGSLRPATERDAEPFVLERVRPLDDVAPVDVAEAFRDLPGLALLESARPGRRSRWTFLTADPLDAVERAAAAVERVAETRVPLAPTGVTSARTGVPPTPDGRVAAVGVTAAPTGGPRAGAGRPAARAEDPFADARRLLAAMDGEPAGLTEATPPFIGGLVGFLGYDLGRELERLPALALDDQRLPVLRLALHDWVIAWDRVTGCAWLAGRAVEGGGARLASRLEAVRRRLERAAAAGWPPARIVTRREAELGPFVSRLPRDRYELAIQAVRAAIARGEIYQANLSRRLEAPFRGDPWPLYRRLRVGDPALYAAYLDLGGPDGAGRAILSASPEPFLAVDRRGVVVADPIKGTRRRGRDRAGDRALAAELLASAKDRAENVMIVDVLRNDLGRVCRPGSVRVPRLCRLERTATVQHLVSTVTGVLRPGCDAFDLLAAAFPGGSITGAPKIRAMEILETLEPVRRGPYTGALGWIGPDGAMATSILIRTFVADGRRLTLNVGGGITYRSDAAAEWDETVAKAAGPLGAIGAREA